MFSELTPRRMLAATASLTALAIGVVVTQPLWQHPQVASAPPQVAAPSAEVTPEPITSNDLKAEEPAVPAPEADIAATAKQSGTQQRSDAPADAAAAESASDALQAGELKESMAGGMGEPVMEAAPEVAYVAPSTESFANADPNPVKITADEPVSTFSVDVDTASYSYIRSSLNGGSLPGADAVRIEEMINYFSYDYPAPKAGGAPFQTSLSLFQTPWNKDTELLRVGLQGTMPAIGDRPPLNLVFLIDTSGSMNEPNKLPLLIQSFRLMLDKLRDEDQVAIVTYAGSAGLVLAPTPATDRTTISAALERLAAGGSTAGAEGLMQAYQVADSMKAEGRISRVILATDGDFNVGLSDPEALKTFIARERDSGTYLSVLGFGRGNLDDATMQALAQNGNGQAAYIDTLAEAQKVLVEQLSGALFPIADDVKIQIEFNPAAIAEYRLIGYETRSLAREDFNNDRVDAGEIGAGLQVTALYELVPVGSPARLADPLRYGTQTAISEGDIAELGFLKLRYKDPGSDLSKLIQTPIPIAQTAPDQDAIFAAAIAGMGQLLSDPKYLGAWGWADAITLAGNAKGEDPFGYRAEAIGLMRLAQSLAKP